MPMTSRLSTKERNVVPEQKTDSGITFTDCLESVQYEIEDALERFPDNKDLFLHQVRLLIDKLQKGVSEE